MKLEDLGIASRVWHSRRGSGGRGGGVWSGNGDGERGGERGGGAGAEEEPGRTYCEMFV